MGNFDITKFFIYRWRYQIGYILVAAGLIAILIFAGLYLPGGISNAEMQSVVKSDSITHIDLNSLAMTNLPYHLLQKASVALFGVTILSIKLPSIILALLSAAGLVILLKRWFKPRIGILASLIAITTGQFIFIAQDGTPGILYLFWSVCLLLLASSILQKSRFRSFYKLAFFIAVALSLYTPLSIYVLIALVSSAILHPHLRYLLKQLSRLRIIVGIVIALLLLTPLILAIIKTPSLGLTLIGIPTQWPDFNANLASLGAQYLGFANPGGTTIMTPFFELGSMMLIIIGIYHVIRTRATAKSYTIAIWILCLIPVIILNPSFTSIVFLPLVLLLASGLNTLISHWYELFPLNPYARIGGLIPIVILVIVLVLSGAERYVYGYHYDPNIAPNFSRDIRLIPKDTKNILVTQDELPFYSVIAKYNHKLTILTAPQNNSFLATRAIKQVFPDYSINRIITSTNFNDGSRFYLYKKITD